MRKHRHLPLVAILCLFFSGFSFTHGQQQPGKIQNHLFILLRGTVFCFRSQTSWAGESLDRLWREPSHWFRVSIYFTDFLSSSYPGVRERLFFKWKLGFAVLVWWVASGLFLHWVWAESLYRKYFAIGRAFPHFWHWLVSQHINPREDND